MRSWVRNRPKLDAIAAFAVADVFSAACAAAAGHVRTSSVGKGTAALASASAAVIAIVRPVLDRLGYSE